MSFILFSPDGTYDSLLNLTGIESDPHMRCWGVKYADGETKKTGPQDKMEEVRCFEIDGNSGERVVKVEIGMNSLVQGVKVCLIPSPSISRIALKGSKEGRD